MSYSARKFNPNKDLMGRTTMVDRTAYINYLETELERVANAARLMQSTNDRMDEFQQVVNNCDSKIASNTRLVKIAQNYSEQLEDEMKRHQQATLSKTRRLEESVSVLEEQNQNVTDRMEMFEQKLMMIADKLTSMESRMNEEIMARNHEMEHRFSTFKANMLQQLQNYKQEAQGLQDKRNAEFEEELDKMREEIARSGARRDGDAKEAEAEMTKKIRDVSDEVHSVRGSLEDCSVALSKKINASMEELTTKMMSATSKMEEQNMSVRQTELKVVKEVHDRLESMSGLQKDVEIIKRQLVANETQNLRQNDTLTLKLQSLETRCQCVEEETKHSLTKLTSDIEKLLSSARFRYEESEKIKDMERRMSQQYDECLSQVNMMTKLYSQNQSDLQETQLRTRRLESILTSSGDSVRFSNPSFGSSSVSPLRSVVNKTPKSAVSPDVSQHRGRPLESTIKDLQALVQSMEVGDDKSPVKKGPLLAKSAATLAASKVGSDGDDASDLRGNSDNDEEYNGISDVKVSNLKKEQRRQRLRQLYKELTALEVEEAKERKHKRPDH